MTQKATSPRPVQNHLARTIRTLTPTARVILSRVIPRAEQVRVFPPTAGPGMSVDRDSEVPARQRT